MNQDPFPLHISGRASGSPKHMSHLQWLRELFHMSASNVDVFLLDFYEMDHHKVTSHNMF